MEPGLSDYSAVEPHSPTPWESAFEQFWTAYPRKTGKGAARQKWNAIRGSGKLFAIVMQSLEAHSRCEQWTREQGRFIPLPTTWLNQKRWEDQPQMLSEAPRIAPEAKRPPFLTQAAADRYVALKNQIRAENTEHGFTPEESAEMLKPFRDDPDIGAQASYDYSRLRAMGNKWPSRDK